MKRKLLISFIVIAATLFTACEENLTLEEMDNLIENTENKIQEIGNDDAGNGDHDPREH